MSTYEIDLNRYTDDDEFESVIQAAEYAQRIIDGTDGNAGKKLGRKIFDIISSGNKLTHPLIIFGNKIKVPISEPNVHGYNIQARDSDFNRGLLEGLGISAHYAPTDFKGFEEYDIHGRTVTAEPLFDPSSDLTFVEEEGLVRRMRTTVVNSAGEETTVKLPAGFRVIPQFALRVAFPGMVEEV